MNWLKARLREPTTWGGLISILTLVGVALTPEQKEAVIGAGVAIGGLVMVFMPEVGAQ
jgi:hypothetical protein